MPDEGSQSIYQRAHELKEMRLYPDCHHGFGECRDQVDTDLRTWLTAQLASQTKAVYQTIGRIRVE